MRRDRPPLVALAPGGGVVIAVDLHARDIEGFRIDGTVALVYDDTDPFCAHLVFDVPLADGGHVVWSFDRDLLADGLHAPAGIGDVQVYPHLSGRVCISLRGTDDELTLMCLHREVADFVEDTYFRVPRGTEDVDVAADAELFLLLAREAL